MERVNILEVVPDKNHLSAPRRFYVDCPIDTCDDYGRATTECRRIEIPRELARFITNIQSENRRLESELKKALDE